MADKARYVFRMAPLPKEEYLLMKRFITQYSLDGPCELFTVALRLMDEVGRYNNGQGQQWIQQVISTYRDNTCNT